MHTPPARVHGDALVRARQRSISTPCAQCCWSCYQEHPGRTSACLSLCFLHAPHCDLFVFQEIARQTDYANRWLALDDATKNKVKQDALMALASPTGKIGTVAAQVVSAIAAVELPHGQWMDVVGILLGFVSDAANVNLRVATLQAIGFICEALQSVRTLSSFFPSVRSDMRCRNPRSCRCGQTKS